MVVRWSPQWYELDQSIVAGDVDFFYLSSDCRSFANGPLIPGDVDCEVRAEIVRITHPELGDVRGIVAIGLDYSLYLSDGRVVLVNAEEEPGRIYDTGCAVEEWGFDVQLRVVEQTGLSARERLHMLPLKERQALRRERIGRYKALLGLTEADWDC